MTALTARPVDRVAVIGLGKLGFPIAAVYADRGYSVVGVDVNPFHVEQLNQAKSPIYEPGLGDLLTAGKDRLRATVDAGEAVRETDISFIIVPTPSEAAGGFSLKYVLDACRTIGEAIRDKADWHLVVVTSTVMPGSTDGEIRSTLEAASGKPCGDGFGLCYSPEFIALGSVVNDLLFPDFLLVGQSDERSGDLLSAFYRSICETNPPIARMNNVNAELAKLSVNTFVTTKITFANMLTHICERLPGADVDVVTKALGLDSRIGKKYLRGSLGYGGPCFPRDNVALSQLADSLNVPSTLAVATDKANRHETEMLAARVRKFIPNSGVVGILGLSYKPNTDVITESPGVALAQSLMDNGYRVVGYDPAALPNAVKELGGKLVSAASMEECIGQSDVVVITTPDPVYTEFDRAALSRAGTPRTIIDCWRMLDPASVDDADYVAVGRGRLRGQE